MTDLKANDPVGRVVEYHQRSKHHLNHYARSPGSLDWATQPDPFRRYAGASRVSLALPPEPGPEDPPTWTALFAGTGPPASLSAAALSRFLYDSLALSAWKRVGASRWSLRVNPSSGDLHPTEGYLLLPALEGVSQTAGVWHYDVYGHALELRTALTDAVWAGLTAGLPPGGFLVGLSAIAWRESWKYGERAFRYCHLDVGHAVGALALSAAVSRWRVRRLEGLSGQALAVLLGLHAQGGPEAEHPELLLWVGPSGGGAPGCPFRPPPEVLSFFERAAWSGRPNRLSPGHRDWPVIEEISRSVEDPGSAPCGPAPQRPVGLAADQAGAEGPAARYIIRRRRSAVAMDGHTGMGAQAFYQLLTRLLPARNPEPLAALGWAPEVALALFVHRVEGLAPGVYLLPRAPAQGSSLRSLLRQDLAWTRPPDCPASLPLWLLERGDARQAARVISCHQDIAADGVFSLGMLARLDTIRERGAWWYPRLYWECGLIGHQLYLEAEARALRGTGIGCFFDDAAHGLLGLEGTQWQDLYHFTVGGSVDDPRIQTLPPYAHRTDP